MPQAKQTKSGGKADGGSQKQSTAEELPESTEEKSVDEIVTEFGKQDRDTGIDPVNALQAGEVKNQGPDTDESWNAPPPKSMDGFLLDQVKDERDLPIEKRAEGLFKLYDQHTGRTPILIGLWVFVNILDKDMEAARSKSPQKNVSYKFIANHKDLPPDLKGQTLGRYVVAGVTAQELESDGVKTDPMSYRALYETSKIPSKEGRKSVAKEVIAKSLNLKATCDLVQAKRLEETLDETSPDSKFSPLAKKAITWLQTGNMSFGGENAELKPILSDANEVRTKLNFREQTKIYGLAEKIRSRKLGQSKQLAKDLGSMQECINFLETLLNAFDSEAVEPDTQV
ncbi:MAG: hypothetical protein ACLP5H_09855 [Desulfomonilaceae bacterium]